MQECAEYIQQSCSNNYGRYKTGGPVKDCECCDTEEFKSDPN